MGNTIRKTIPAPSAAMSWNGNDIPKLLKGAAIAFGGAVLGSLVMWAVASLQADVFVSWEVFGRSFLTFALPAALSVGINAVKLWWQGQPKVTE